MFCKKNKVILSKIGNVLLLVVKHLFRSLASYYRILLSCGKSRLDAEVIASLNKKACYYSILRERHGRNR